MSGLRNIMLKFLKIALTRELGDEARLIYTIKMENTFGK